MKGFKYLRGLLLAVLTLGPATNARAVTFEIVFPPIAETSGSIDAVFRVSASAAETGSGSDCFIAGAYGIAASGSALPPAEDGSDFLAPATEQVELFIQPGSGAVVEEIPLSIQIINDQQVEPTQEVFGIEFVAETGDSGPGECFGTPIPSVLSEAAVIADDDALQYTFSPASVSVNENSSVVEAELTLANPADSPVEYSATIGVSAQSGTALAGSDFEAITNDLLFDEAQTTNTFTVVVIDDNAVEDNEVFQIAEAAGISAVDSSGNPLLVAVTNAVAVTIISEDVPDEISMLQSNLSVSEDAGSAQVSVARTGSLAGVVSVNYATFSGSAIEVEDFEGTTGTLTFAAGDAGPQTISIPVVDDGLNEPGETFEVRLSDPQGAAVLGADLTEVEITDDDFDDISFALATLSVGEDSGTVSVDVVRTGSALGTVTVEYTTLAGSAAESEDFAPNSGVLTFAAGDLGPQTIEVEVLDNNIDEADESFELVLNNPTGAAALGLASSTITILDDDAPLGPTGSTGDVLFSTDSLSVSEDVGSVTISVARVNGTAGTVSVDFSASALDALAGEDFELVAGQLQWSDGDAAAKTFELTVINDNLIEDGETLTIELTNYIASGPAGTGGVGTPSVLSVLLVDDDVVSGSVEFVEDSVTVGEEEGTVELEIARRGAPAGAISVEWATIADTAEAAGDFESASGVIVWDDGDAANKTVVVTLISDLTIEGLEEFSVQLSNAQGATVGDAATVTVAISDVGQALAELPGLNAEERELAQAIDASCDNLIGAAGDQTADQADLLFICGTVRNGLETSEQVSAALDAISGDELITAATSSLKLLGLQHNSFRNRLSGMRAGNSSSFDVSGLAVEVDGQYLSGAVLEEIFGALTGGAAGDDSFGQLSFYVNGKIDFGEKDRDSANQGYEFDAQTLTLGADYRLTDNVFIGAALGYEMADVKFAQGGALDVGGWKGSVYGSYFSGDEFYVDVQASYGRNDYSSERRIVYDYVGGRVDRTAKGDTKGDQFTGGIASGLDYNRGRFTFGPNIALSYFDVGVKSFAEEGAGGLNLEIGRQNQRSLTFTGGAHASYVINTRLGVVIPHARIDYVHEFITSPEVASVGFAVDSLGADPALLIRPLQIEAEVIDKNYFLWALGTSMQFVHGISGYVSYQSTEGYSGLKLQQLAYGLRLERTY